MTEDSQPPASALKTALYEQFLRCLEREEHLTHYRTSWGLQWTIALFSSIIAIQQVADKVETRFLSIAYLLITLSGILVSIAMFFAIKGGHNQISYLIVSIHNAINETNVTANDEGLKSIAIKELEKPTWVSTEFLRPFGEIKSSHSAGIRFSLFFPVVIFLIWLGIAVYQVGLII